jgi:hypothetical protein
LKIGIDIDDYTPVVKQPVGDQFTNRKLRLRYIGIGFLHNEFPR